MPKLTINGHVVQVDDSFLKLPPEQQDATVDEIAQSLPAAKSASAAASAPAAAPAAIGAQDWDLGSEVLNGMTFGTLPNLQAGVLAGVRGLKNAIGYDGPTMADTYDKELASAQGARRAYQAEHPIIAALGDIGGGLATGGGLVKSGVTLVGREMPAILQAVIGGSKAAKVAANVGASALEGGAYSAAGGFGGGEGGFDKRLENAEKNIPAGVVFGAGSVPAAALISHGANTIGNLYRSATDPAGQGTKMLVQAIMRDKQTPEQLATSVEQARAAGQTDFVPVDAAGRNTQRLFKMATRTPGEFRNDAAQFLDARQAGQGDRLQGYVDQATGNVGPKARELERGITASRATKADANYEKSYAAPAPQGAFYDEMLQRQSVKDAMRGVEDMAAEKQIPLTDLFTEVPNPNAQTVTREVETGVLGPDGKPLTRTETTVENPTLRIPTMRGWDMIKRNLDTQVDSGFRSSDAQQRALAQAVKQTRDQLRGRLAADNPDYAKALGEYTDDTTALNNIQAGRDLVKSPSDDIVKETFDAVPEGQRDLARSGAAAELKKKITGPTGSGTDRTRMLDSDPMREVLDRVAVDPTARAAIGNAGIGPTRSGQLGREQAMAGTRRLVAGGSDTVENLLEQPAPGIGQAVGLAAAGRPVRAAGMGFEVLRRALSGLREEGAKAIGDVLMSKDPEKIRGLADLFANAQQIASQPSTLPAILSAGFGAARQRTNNGMQSRR